jgi:hypothetical protein
MEGKRMQKSVHSMWLVGNFCTSIHQLGQGSDSEKLQTYHYYWSRKSQNTDRYKSLRAALTDPDIASTVRELANVRIHAKLQSDGCCTVRHTMSGAVLLTTHKTLLYQPLRKLCWGKHQYTLHLRIWNTKLTIQDVNGCKLWKSNSKLHSTEVTCCK